MRNTKQNCFWHSSASPRNNKQCSAKQCFANQTNMCLADFASRSDLFLDNEHGLQNIVEKLISDTSFWKPCTQPCDLRFSNQAMFFFCFGVTQTINRECAKPFCFLFLVFWLSSVAALTLHINGKHDGSALYQFTMIYTMCLRHCIPVWQYNGQSTTATSRQRRDMTSHV